MTAHTHARIGQPDAGCPRCEEYRTRTVTLDEDALFALARIAEHRRTPIASDAQARAVREEVRSYAIEVVNAILRACPELAEGLGEVRT